MSDFPDSTMCLLSGGAMDGQRVPIADGVNRIEMFTKGGTLIAYNRVNWQEFKAVQSPPVTQTISC